PPPFRRLHWRPDDGRDGCTAVSDRRVTVGVVGLGYWGPNLARNFARLPGCHLRWCCDTSPAALDGLSASWPETRFTADLDELLADPDLDAVALATPVATHGPLGPGGL